MKQGKGMDSMADKTKSQARAQRKLLNAVYESKKGTIYYLCLGMTGSQDLAESLTVQALDEIRSALGADELPEENELGRKLVLAALKLCKECSAELNEQAEAENLPFWHVLEEDQKELFVLRYLADLTNKDIAAELGLSLKQVTGACTTLDNHLSKLMEQNFGIDCGSRAAVPVHIRQRIVVEQSEIVFPASIDQEATQVLNPDTKSSGKKSGKKKWWILGICIVVCAVIVVVLVVVLTADTADAVNADYYAEIEIEDYGTITVALDAEAAPETVENFVSLAESGFYDGLTFHRIIDGFMMQGGDPNGDGTGGSDETIVGEFSDNGYENNLSHTRGAISMAREEDDYDSASSQFFIVQEDSTYLDGSYAVFGYVIDGMDIVDTICEEAEPTDDNGTIEAEDQPVITTITIYTPEEYEALS